MVEASMRYMMLCSCANS